jgi:hypothetical protein
MGGLGNQLFQIATTIALAALHNDRAVFDPAQYTSLSQGRPPAQYKSTIYHQLTFAQLPKSIYTYREIAGNYQSIPYRSGLQLFGFFQSWQYFESYRQELINIFTPPEPALADLRCKYQDILNQPNCAVHVRRGDYLRIGRTISLDYYSRAIARFPSDTKFLVFSDDLDWCKKVFFGAEFSFASGNVDDLDLILISLCQHQIIANSTFSCWGAWLNRNPRKVTIAPKSWISLKPQIYTQEMILL